MTPARKHFLHQLISIIMLCSMLFSTLAPLATVDMARAQEETQEPTVESTEEIQPTATETALPETATPVIEVTAETTPEATAVVTAEVTETVVATTEVPTETTTPTAVPVTDIFKADFEDNSTAAWFLSPGWQLVSEEGNTFLAAMTPAETATIIDVDWAHFLMAARVRIDPANSASILLRSGAENYTLEIDADGQTRLLRGANLIAQGPTPAALPEGEEPIAVWRKVNIQALGAMITVAIDGVVQFSYSDSAPLGAGMIVFGTGATNTDMVAFDDVVINKLDEPVEIVETETPVVTGTMEATVEATAEVTAEATEEPTEEAPIGNLPILTASFETETTGWLMSEGASIVDAGENNHALLLTAGSSFTPADALYLADFRVETRLSLSAANSGNLEFSFRAQDESYLLSLGAGEIALSRQNGAEPIVLATAASGLSADTWYTLSLTAQGNVISVFIDGAEALSFTDETPLLNGQIGFGASGDVLLDNIVVIDLGTTVFAATAVPSGLTDADREKLQDTIFDVVSLYMDGEVDAAVAMAETSFIPVLDDQHRIRVVVHANSGETGTSIRPIIEAANGIISSENDYNLEADIPLANIASVIANGAIFSIVMPDRATSSGTMLVPPAAGTGDVIPHSLDQISANDWFLENYRGNGVNIGVIDTGFQGSSGGGNFSCLNNVSGGNGTGSHGLEVIQVICDVAPNSNVRGYRVTSTNDVRDAINQARSNGNRIIVIPLDLGVHVSPGDGTDGGVSGTSVYDAITTARNAGILVVTSAGNNNQNGYKSWAYSGATTFNITMEEAGTVSVVWNNWNPANAGAREDFSLSIDGTISNSTNRAPNDNPGFQAPLGVGPHTIIVTKRGAGDDTVADYLQLQTTGEITSTSVGAPNTTSTIGRPGDSPDAFTVGAVCASQTAGFPLLPDSSRGPLYSAGGNQPPAIPNNAPSTVKPDIVGMSHVSVADNLLSVGCNILSDPEFGDGFNGTSAATAHIAGMAALLISNSNMNIPSGNGTADALRVYMQTHSISTITAGSISNGGFNNVYGSGVAVLGDPSPDSDVSAFGTLTDVVGLPGTTHYVGRVTASVGDSPQSGTLAQPFFSLPEAIDHASPGDSLVLLPGDYVTGIVIDKSVGIYAYNQLNSGDDTTDSDFWANNSYIGVGGLNATANNVILDGFDFTPSQPEGIFGGSGDKLSLTPSVVFSNVTGGQLSNSTFRNYVNVTPVSVENSPGVTIEENVFEDNDASAQRVAALTVVNSESGSSANPVIVIGNEFIDNIGSISILTELDGIVLVQDSAANFVGNYFTGNNSETLVRVNNLNVNTDGVVNFYSNFFLNNQAGTIIHLKPGRRFRFTNNSVIGNTQQVGNSIPHDFIINRDDPQPTGGVGGTNWSPDELDGNWDVHNNLFFDNTGYGAIAGDTRLDSTCDALSGGSNNGVTHNWIFNSGVVSGPAAGDCQLSLENLSFNNITLFTADPLDDINPADDFLGVNPLFEFDATEPDYYRLGETSIGIDAGNGSVPNSVDDFGDNDRVVNGIPDIGAFELVPLTADPITTNRTEDLFNQVGDVAAVTTPNYITGAFAIDLSNSVDGGFPPYTFGVKSNPANFSTDVNDFCGGSGVIVQGSLAYYCPPQHFYTNGVPPTVEFEYRVYDRFGTGPSAFNTITVNIAPVNDVALSTSIGTYNYITKISAPFSLRLRPFARYDNFRFSEAGNAARGNQADYPFTYSNVALVPEAGDNDNLFTLGAISAAVTAAGPDGLITLDPADGEIGYLSFSYTVRDRNNNPVSNTIRIEVAGVVPDRGLHDDTSLSFDYTDGWSPIYSEGNINNTLHEAKKIDDTASFTFIGEGFTLYMQASRKSGNYQLRVDDSLLTWTTSNNQSTATAGDGFTCFTTAKTNGNLIANNDRSQALYTVTCRNMRDGEAHTVEVINKATRSLSVDAISINFVDDPLLPRFHDVNERNILPLFPGWSMISDKKASNGVALTTSTLGEINFTFQGTGISFGTGLEKTGAKYDICITPENQTEVCTSFDNSLGAARRGITWDVFRSFYGFDPTEVHEVRLVITSLPTNGKMVIDSITVFDEQPTAPLSIGVTENDQIGPIIFGNGRDDSWLFDTRNKKASNSSLHSVARRTNYAGPFVSFNIPANANSVLWYRLAGKRDSTALMICVDRAQGEAASGQCREVNLRTQPNPLIISESDFTGGWGTGFTSDDVHTIEIFSLVNEAFNMDKIQVIANTQPLQPSYYEENTLQAGGSAYSFFTNSNVLSSSQFTSVNVRSASGGTVARTVVANAGAYFQMNGTGFAAYFTQNRNAGNVTICWVPGIQTDIPTILAGNCRTYNNYSSRTQYQVGYATIGLSDTPANFSVVIRNDNSATMEFDALEIFGALPTSILTGNAQRYETNYNTRNSDDLFLYFGNGWRNRTNTRASGGDQDDISRKIGAGIVFTTDGVDTVEIISPSSKKAATLEVCIDGVNCVTYSGTDRPIVARLPDTNQHVVSVTTLSANAFTLDAVDVYNYAANPMTPGRYENTSALMKFDDTWSTSSNKSYSGRSAQQTNTNGGTMLFHFTGSIFQIGAVANQVNQMRVCYVTGFEPDENAVNANCDTWPPTVNSGVQIMTIDTGADDTYTVRVVNEQPAQLLVDFAEIAIDAGPLVVGLYEETHPAVDAGLTGSWIPATDKNFSGGTAVQTTTLSDSLVFEFEGTGFAVGTSTGSTGGNMLVCYEAGSLSGTPASIDANCYTYNNLGRNNKLISRSVDGLTDGTYSVRVVNLSDGSLLEIDYVEIFDTTLSTIEIENVGGFNENALVAPAVNYLAVIPADRWASVSGRSARNYSGSSYVTVVDTRGRASRSYAGPLAMLSVEVPAIGSGGTTTVVLDTGTPSRNNSNQLLICVEDVTTASCSVSDMTTTQYHTVELNNDTASVVTQTVTFRALTAGNFTIDGYQVIVNSSMATGLYDDPLMTVDGIINTSNDWNSGGKNRRSFGGTYISTNTNNATLEFLFTGTGFSLITQQSSRGVDFELCYAPTDTPLDETCLDLSSMASGKTLDRYGHTVYGLEPDDYTVTLRVNDTNIGSRDSLVVDAIAIFGDVTTGSTALQPGLYDDSELTGDQSPVRFAPELFWDATIAKNGPPRGPWQLTESGSSNIGAIMQVFVEGNALTIYQKVDNRSSAEVQVCLVIESIEGNLLECTDFSQRGRRTYFTPIMLYGFGSGEHQVIFENLDSGRFNVDALQVIP